MSASYKLSILSPFLGRSTPDFRSDTTLALDGDNPEIRRIADEIDRLLGPGGGPSAEDLGPLLFMTLAAVMGRSKKGR